MPSPGPSTGFVLAVDFGGTKLDVATATPDGSLVLAERLETHADRGADQAIERALDRGRALVAATAQRLDGDLLAVGASSPGIVLEDRILLAPNVPGWTTLALGERLRDAFATDAVVCETDVKAAALAESRWGALRGADPGVFLSLGTGLAAGIVLGGRVLRGANGAAGEIGYALRGVHDAVGAAGGRAPLEEHAGGRALGERGARLLGTAPAAADVFARAAGGDPEARLLVDETLDELAVHVANLAIALDPARIAVGGGMMGSADVVLAALRGRVRDAVPFPPEVVAARFVHDAALRGAAALALDAAHPSLVPVTHPAISEEEQHP
jgi:glucokinase